MPAALMVQQFLAISAALPLAMNAPLLAGARLHSGDQLTNNFQGHYGSDRSDPGTRIRNQGYTWITYGENVFACADSVLHGHAGFEVDWGGSVGGMQSPPGHRKNIHNTHFSEVGIGIVNGSNGDVGPQVVTQDFSTRSGATPLVTGVAYYDFNGNGSYDPGEGLGGVHVEVDGSSYDALSANSGGYAVPVPSNGTYLVRFTASGLAADERSVTVSDSRNVKVDFTPAYVPPVISGPNPAVVGQANSFLFTPVGAAVDYEWKCSQLVTGSWVEGAENGLSSLTVSASTNYSVIDSSVRASGSASFHLAHPQPADQYLQLNRVIRPGPDSQLTFASRLGWASASQIARAQVSTNGGRSWTEVFTRAGTGTSGQTGFVRSTNSLAGLGTAHRSAGGGFGGTGGPVHSSSGPGGKSSATELHRSRRRDDGVPGGMGHGTERALVRGRQRHGSIRFWLPLPRRRRALRRAAGVLPVGGSVRRVFP